jgi:hypothetical protein
MLHNKKSEAKITELVNLILETPQKERKGISWKILNQWRLQALKARTEENAMRLALLNVLLKESPNNDPYLPQKVIDFLRPVIQL